MNTRVLPGMLAPRYHELQPGIAEQRHRGDAVHVRDPCRLRLGRRFDGRVSVRAHVLDAVRDPVHVLLDRHHHVGEHRRAAGPRDGEQVREPGDAEAEVGDRPRGPRVAQRDAVAPADVDAEQRSGHRVETRREHDRVHYIGRVADVHRVLGDCVDRRAAHVDEVNVRLVERLVVAAVDARSLAAHDDLRREQLRDLGVVHHRPDLGAGEVGGVLVRLVGEQ